MSVNLPQVTSAPPEPPLIGAPIFPDLPDCGSTGIWDFVSAANGKVLTWYNDWTHQQYANVDRAMAQTHAANIDGEIWKAFLDKRGLNMRAPVDDPGGKCDGGSPALDIYVGTEAINKTIIPHYGTLTFPAAAVILLRHYTTKEALAHELFHAIQAAYAMKNNDINEYWWLREATAYWAPNYVYPDAKWVQAESLFLLNQPEVSLELLGAGNQGESGRGASLYIYFMAGKNAANALRVREIWENGSNKTSLEAVDAAAKFADLWHDFARANWNRPPVTDNANKPRYQDWETVPSRRLTRGAKHTVISTALNGKSGKNISLDLNLKHLSAKYYWLQNFNEVRYLAFVGSPHGKPSKANPFKILALMRIAGEGWREEDWTGKVNLEFFFDQPGQCIEELILIASNCSTTFDAPASWGPTRIHVSRGPIRRKVTGTARATEHCVFSTGGDFTITADTAAIFRPDSTEPRKYVLESGTTTYKAFGGYSGCSVTGALTVDLVPGPASAYGGGDLNAASSWFYPDVIKGSGMGSDNRFGTTIICPNAPPYHSGAGYHSWLGAGGDDAKWSDDGMIFKGRYQFTNTGEGGYTTYTYEWDFHIAGAPGTTVVPSPPPATVAGWNNEPIRVALTATGGSEVAEITYWASGAQPIPRTTVTGSSASVNISAEGLTTLSYCARDVDDAVESARALEVKIDKTAPTVSASVEPLPDTAGWHHSHVTVMLQADDTLSGVASITYSASGAQSIPDTTVDGCAPVLVTIAAEGTTTLTVTAADDVGNKSDPQKITLNIAKPA